MIAYQVVRHVGLGVQECPTDTIPCVNEVYQERDKAEKRANELWLKNTTPQDRSSNWCYLHYGVKQIEIK
jgi:hypothetical protein